MQLGIELLVVGLFAMLGAAILPKSGDPTSFSFGIKSIIGWMVIFLTAGLMIALLAANWDGLITPPVPIR